jgi:hypothetical protein
MVHADEQERRRFSSLSPFVSMAIPNRCNVPETWAGTFSCVSQPTLVGVGLTIISSSAAGS